jgi:predicted enzyme related to lactoylglutathione lyase
MKVRTVLTGILVLVCLMMARGACAQQLAPPAPPDHVHLYVPDPEQTLAWYMKHFGGERTKNNRPDSPDLLLFDKTVFRFTKSTDAKPDDGSVLDRVGFTVDDVDAKAAEVAADGGKLLQRINTVAFLQDPWGGKIEILHPDGVASKKLFLIGFRSTDPAALEKWVGDTFGGTPDKLFGRVDGIKYGDMWLIFQKNETETAPSRGHMLDHIGWAVPDTNAAIASAKPRGYKVTIEPRSVPPMTIAFIEGPNGFAVELTQTGPAPAK